MKKLLTLLMIIFSLIFNANAVSQLYGDAGDSEVYLSWDYDPLVIKYYIYRDLSSPATTLYDSVIVVTPFDTVFTDFTVINGEEYYYRITAVDALLVESDFSNEVKLTPSTINNGLIAFYDLNNDGFDGTGNGYDGSVNGAFVTENRFNQFDGAMQFNGSANVFINSSSHPTGEVTVTYSAWIKPEAENQVGNIVFVGDRITNERSALILDNGALAYVGEGNDYTSGAVPPVNEWSHVAVVKTGISLEFYMNGEFMEFGSTTTGQNITNSQIFIGSTSDDAEFFEGAIDEVRLYNRAVSAEEISLLYYEYGWDFSNASKVLVPRFNSGVVLDGLADETDWLSITEIDLYNLIGDTPTAADFSATYKTAWDSTNFYVFINVFDDFIVEYNANSWDNDNVELYFNFDKSNNVYPESDWYNHYDYEEHQIRFVPNSEIDGLNVPAGVNFAQNMRGDGYSFEIAIPWTSFNIPGFGVGQTFGFNVQVYDQDEGPNNVFIWSNPGILSHYQPAGLGLAGIVDDSGAKPLGPYLVVEADGMFIPNGFSFLDYGNHAINPGNSISKTFEVYNFGQDTLSSFNYFPDFETFSELGFDYSAQLAEDESFRFAVEAFLDSYGVLNDVLNIESNDPSSPFTVDAQISVFDFVDVEYTTEAFTIDAIETETYWSTATISYSDNNVVDGFITDSYDFSGTWKVAWDKESLYFFFNYMDDSIVNFSGDPTQNDAIDIIFDRLNDRDGYNAMEYDNGYYRFYVDGPIDGENVDFGGVESHTIINDTGFVMEAKIPFTSLDFGNGLQFLNDFRIGFDVVYSDNDDGVSSGAHASWGNYTNVLPQVNANNHGELKLFGRPDADLEFNVDMRVQILKGVFVPGTDFVDVPSFLNDWGNWSIDTLYDIDGDSIYSRTYYGLNAGENIEYKFRLNGDWAQPHEFNGGENRTYTLDDGLNIAYHTFNDEYATDLEITQIIQPMPYALYSANESVVVAITNVGINPVSNFDISFYFDTVFITETVAATILPGEVLDYEFAQTLDLSNPGGYSIDVMINDPSDENSLNDSQMRHFWSQLKVSSFPYFEDFESGDGFWAPGDDNGITTWEYGMPAGSVINSAYSGDYAWVTNPLGETPAGERSWFTSPIFDFTDLLLPYISFQKFAQLNTELSAVTINYSVDTGKVWNTLGATADDTNWYETHFPPILNNFSAYPRSGWTESDVSWEKVAHHLSNLAGEPWVQFVIGYANDDETVEGFAIDDVEVYDAPPQYNAAILSIDVGDNCNPLVEQPVVIEIRNQGLNPITNFDVAYVIDNSNNVADEDTIVETFTGTINPGDTVSYVFSTTTPDIYTREFSKGYSVSAFVDYPLDGLHYDDRVVRSHYVFGDFIDKPGWTSYNTCDGLFDNRIWSIVESVDGDVWFTGFYGIDRFDGTSFTHYNIENGLADNYSWTSLEDINGNLWFPGTSERKITQFNGTDFIIHDIPGVFGECSYEDFSGNLWFGSYDGDGVLMYDGTDFMQFPLEEIGMGYYMNSVGQLPNGNIVFGTDAGVVQFDGSTWSEFDLNGEYGVYVSEIFNDFEGRTWFAAYGRLIAFDGSSWYETNDVNGITVGSVDDIDQASNGNIYFGGGTSLFRFSNGNWNVFTEADGVIPSNGIYAVNATSDGKVWIGTYNGGVASYSNAQAEVVFFVDMYYQYEAAAFDPTIDSVFLNTSLNNHSNLIPMLDTDGDGIYKVGFENLPVGTYIEYNYYVNGTPEAIYPDTMLRSFVAYDAYNEIYDIYNDEIPTDQCNANFDYLVNGSTVEFYNTSLGDVTNFFWSFGDGGFSESENPIYTFTYEDYFEVCLTIYNETTGCVDEFCDVIAIIDSSSVACNADFGFETSETSVVFTNNSQGNITDYFWDFGDGNYSYSANPTHTYAEAGIYDVYLGVYDSVNYCYDDVIKVVSISVEGSVTCNASYSYFIEGTSVVFTNKSSNNITDYFWDFGDGSYSYAENPTHNYDYSDFYEVTLGVYDSASGCVDDVTKFIVVVDSNTVSCNANYSYIVNDKKVSFTNNSQGNITDYFWDFGDGNYSYAENPVHTYAYSDFYEVWLSVYDEESGCFDEYFEYVVVIDSTEATCNADFSKVVTGKKVSFTNKSSGNITDYFWDFGDGSYSSLKGPSHTYTDPGYYEVSLSVYDEASGCLDDKWKTIFVIDSTQTYCNADFEHFVNNKTVSFNSLSQGTVSDYFWSFGDGTFAYSASPSKTYEYPDFYEVTLTVYDETSGCFDEYSEVILVRDSTVASCKANFGFYAENTTFKFKSESRGNITDYFWDFGDGFYAYTANPSHTYSEPDFYYVTLSIYDEASGCLDEFSKVVVVVDSTANLCNANYEFYTDSKLAKFTSLAQGNVTDHFWDFGDGFYSYEENPTHTYAEPDFYEVCYTIYDESTGCLDDFCDVVFVVDTTQAMCAADFRVYTEANSVFFTNKSQGAFTEQFWDFGDGNYSFDKSPSHTYAGPGYYEVGLTIYDEVSGCIDDKYKVVVVVDQTGNSCNARFNFYTEGYTAFFDPKAIGNYSQIFWDFGDGFNSNDESPSHTFAKPGYYEVWLSVIDTSTECYDSRMKIVYIEGEAGATAATKAKFSFIPQADGRTVKFNDESFGEPTSWYWDFGDNSPAGSVQNPTYVYDTNNYYKVNLTVSNDAGSQDTYTDIIAVGDVTNSSFAYFTYFADLVTSTGHFRNESRGNIVSYSWDFGDGYGSEQENPSHTYEVTGYYAVCLTTTSATGEVKSYCNDVRIDNSIDNPCLFSCVWPGDANNDLEANHYDIMTIGLNFGETGPMRDSVSNFWIGHFGQDWSTFQANGTNNKHGDANGDGVINMDDTLAIDQNFAYSHYYTPGKRNNSYEIYVEWDSTYSETKAAAGKARARMARPSKTKEGADIYAIGYEIEVLGGEGILFNSIDVEFNGSWLGTYGEDLLGFYSLDSTKQMIYVGMSRTDQTNVSGGGDLIDIYFNFKDGYDINGVSFIATSLGGIDAGGLGINIGGSFSVDLGEDLEFCAGESVTLDAGEGFATYEWSNEGSTSNLLDVTESGKYYVTVTDSTGTSAIDSILVKVNPLPAVNLGPDVESADPITLDAGAGFTSYEWQDGSNEQTFQVTVTGEYWVMVADNNGCHNADTVNVDITTGITNMNTFGNRIDVYPNPNNGEFMIILDSDVVEDMTVEMFNLQGQRILTNVYNNIDYFNQKIDVKSIDKGVYYLKVIKGDDFALMKMIIQ
jgi:PKD repeat protein